MTMAANDQAMIESLLALGTSHGWQEGPLFLPDDGDPTLHLVRGRIGADREHVWIYVVGGKIDEAFISKNRIERRVRPEAVTAALTTA